MNYKNYSIWNEVKQENIYSSLEKDIKCDVLIIGGGITGLSTAYHLINKGLKVTLVERNEIGSGVTSRTTGKLTYLQESLYSKIKAIHGKDKAKLYLDSQKFAIDLVKNIINKEKINCNLEQVSSFFYSKSNNYIIEKEKKLLKSMNITLTNDIYLPNKEYVKNAFYVNDTYVFHPLKYLYAIKDICKKNNIDIYENTKIISINKSNDDYICSTNANSIRTKYVVIATHYPYFLIPFFMPLKVTTEKSYIEAFKVNDNYKFSAINISKPIVSLRYHTENNINYQIYLTNSHNYCIKNNESQNFGDLIKSNNRKPDYLWSNKDIITNDYLPFIGSISNDNKLLIGTGYNTWGMTNGSLAGVVLADIITNKNNKYIKLFNPKRALNIGKIIKFPIILFSNIYSYTKNKISKNKPWYSSKVKFEIRNGKDVAIYTDELNKEHIVYNLCPHLKCSLIFNEIEKTWDCPCHSSRFDLDGNCIEGPSNYDIKYKE